VRFRTSALRPCDSETLTAEVVNAEGLLIVRTAWATPADRARPPGDPHGDHRQRKPS
jgi:hypothetical protein